MPLPDKMTINPDPPVEEASATLCYDFDEGDTSPVTIRFDWAPTAMSPASCTLSVEEPCFTFTVPSGATAVECIDQSGQSAALGVAVAPS